MDAFYRPLGDERFESTAATAGPWTPEAQHAGPPSALLARAVERHEPAPGMRVGRVAVEILGPVPVAPLHVTARTVRPGRRVQLVEAVLSSGDRPFMRARAWRLAEDAAGPLVAEPEPAPPLPPSASTPTFPGAHMDGYMAAVEWRLVEGDFAVLGPAVVWARPRLPLVADEQTSPLQRVVTVADSGSGVSAAVDPLRWTFLNVDLTVVLHRPPAGEWVCLQARTAASGGVGMAETVLHDAGGRVGRALQTLLVAPR